MTSYDTLFDKNVNLRLQTQAQQQVFNEHEKSSRIATIRVVVKLITHTVPNHRKELLLRLTDDNNWFFLYTLLLGEDDFSILRNSQGLLVDFNTFPNSLIALIKLCENDSMNNNFINSTSNNTPIKGLNSHREMELNHLGNLTSSTGNPNFNSSQYTLNLVQNEKQPNSPANLIISETNAFRQIVHLNLKLMQGDDTDVKEYLAECLSNYKDSYEKTAEELERYKLNMKGKLDTAENEIERLEMLNEELTRELRNKTDTLMIQHQNELNKLREEKSMKEAKYLDTNRKDREDMENLLKSERESYTTKIADQEIKIEELTSRKFRLESSLRENKSKIISLEEENTSHTEELKKLRMFNHDLNLERHDHEQLISSLKTQIALLEQEVKMKLEIIDKMGQQKGDLDFQKQENFERIEEYKAVKGSFLI